MDVIFAILLAVFACEVLFFAKIVLDMKKFADEKQAWVEQFVADQKTWAEEKKSEIESYVELKEAYVNTLMKRVQDKFGAFL